MGALTADDRISGPIAFAAPIAADEVDRALALPRALVEANLRAGSAWLGFAGRQVRAETEFFERPWICSGLAEISAAQAQFVTAMIDACGAGLTAAMALARDHAMQLSGAAETGSPASPGR